MRKLILFFSFFIFLSYFVIAQGISDDYPVHLKRVVILTSGLAYFEHSGTITGNASIVIPFRQEAMSDAIRTLVVNDPASANPSITYQMENSFTETSQIAINTANGLQIFPVDYIRSVKFTDQEIQKQVDLALETLTETKNSSRLLTLNLPGAGTRNVSISYVLPSPVWKVSYRLDLGQAKPVFQGWAIIDNDSDTDWNNVQLSLAAGRPVSFIQRLYPPYYIRRPVQPLSIAGTAQAQTHDRTAPTSADAEYMSNSLSGQADKMYMVQEDAQLERGQALSRSAPAPSVAAGTIQTAQGSEAGGQFEFTIKTPVTIKSKTSAMYPLAESQIEARKILFYDGRGRFPRLGTEITNNTGMKLPAGPITVYDGGIYGGDALIEFWNEKEKRIISFGEDLTVSASLSSTNTTAVSTVTISGGVMTINRTLTYTTSYTFINSDSSSKLIVVEKNKMSNTELVSPKADEQTTNAYRFNVTLSGNKETVFKVDEQRPTATTVALLSQNANSLLSYSTNQEIPQRVRTALQRAVELKQTVETANSNVRYINNTRSRLVSEQERIRQNLQAVGNTTTQGQTYLNRLTSLDKEIDDLTRELEKAETDVKQAQTAFENYINGLNL